MKDKRIRYTYFNEQGNKIAVLQNFVNPLPINNFSQYDYIAPLYDENYILKTF